MTSSEKPPLTMWRITHHLYAFYDYLKSIIPTYPAEPSVRHKLPLDMETWGSSLYEDTYNQIWTSLSPLFQREGFNLWNHSRFNNLNQNMQKFPSPNNYYFESLTTEASSALPTIWGVSTGTHHALRSVDNKDYVVRVMSIAGSGEDHLRILRRLSSTYPDILLSNNHILPIIKEIFYEDIVFGIFPKLSENLRTSMSPGLHDKVSVEDAVYMLMQALEGIAYIHRKNIAHRDLFLENFLVEWAPESLAKPSCTRPRVYLIDFETAVEFSDDSDPSERLCTDLPLPADKYNRSKAPELTKDSLSYCPFRLDIWQFGFRLLEQFTNTGIPEIDNLWPTLLAEIPEERPTADEVLETLGAFLKVTPPQNLQIAFSYVPRRR